LAAFRLLILDYCLGKFILDCSHCLFFFISKCYLFYSHAQIYVQHCFFKHWYIIAFVY